MKNKSSKDAIGMDNEVVNAEPKPKKRKIKRTEKVMTEEPAKDTAEEIAKKLAEENAVSMAVRDKVEQFGKFADVLETVDSPNNDEEDEEDKEPVRVSAFSKYDKMMEDDDDDDDSPRPIKRQMPVSHAEPGVAPISPRGRGAKNKKRETDEGEFVIDDDSASISSLTKGNVWASNVDEIYQMLIEGRRTEHWAENRVHYMNIIAPVFDVQFIDNTDKQLVASLEDANYKIFPYPKSHDDKKNSIAIRKHQIKKITDLTMENILHLSATEVLHLIDENMGTGWKGLPLAIQDIIETAFYVDCSVLPEAAMHRVGGLIDRRKEDGYEVLEIARGTWIEAVFMKFKPRQEKRRFEVISDTSRKSIDDIDDDDDDDDDEEEDLVDETDEDREEEDEDESLEDQTPQIEEFEELPDDDDEDE